MKNSSYSLYSTSIATCSLAVLLAACSQQTVENSPLTGSLSSSGQSKSSRADVTSLSSKISQAISSVKSTATNSVSSKGTPAPSSTKSTAQNVYRDGSYTAGGDYNSPAGLDHIDISLTIKNDIITDASYAGTATVGKSVEYQKKFGEGYKAQVIGKSIASLSLSVVNGSSLTPKGFNAAVAKIKAQAKM